MANSGEMDRRSALKVFGAGLGAATLAALKIGTAQAAAPEALYPAGITPLNYDESNGDRNTPGQKRIAAGYLRDVMAHKKAANEAQLIAAIQGIQEEAQNAGATVREAQSLDFSAEPLGSTWLLWSSNRDDLTQFPADVQFPFGMPGLTFPKLQGQVAIVHAFDPRVTPREMATVACKPGHSVWAVAVK